MALSKDRLHRPRFVPFARTLCNRRADVLQPFASLHVDIADYTSVRTGRYLHRHDGSGGVVTHRPRSAGQRQAPPMPLNTVNLAELFATGAPVALLITLSAPLLAAAVAFFGWRAEQKGRALLRRWLSPAQLEQYEKMGHFEVVGSDSGKRYRIHRYTQMNIEELDEGGARVAVWCFLPEEILSLATSCWRKRSPSRVTSERPSP